MHMEEVFKQVTPIVEAIEKAPQSDHARSIKDALQSYKGGAIQNQETPNPPNTYVKRERASAEISASPMPKSPSLTTLYEEE